MGTLSILPKNEPTFVLPGSQVGQRLLVVHGLRSGLFVSVFLIAQIYQMMQRGFVSPNVWIPVYGALSIVFLLNSFYFIFSDWSESRSWTHAVLFAVDGIAITSLIHSMGGTQSFLIFLYMVDIILAGLVFKKRGAFLQAFWASILLSWLVLITPNANQNQVYFVITINNLAFFSVAYLSGQLSQQMNFMGSELTRAVNKLSLVEDLNKLVLENMQSGMIILDVDARVQSFNPFAKMSFGDGLLIGQSALELFPKLKLPQIFGSRWAQIAEQNQFQERQEVAIHNQKNEKLILEFSVSTLKDHNQSPIGILLIFQDRTEIKTLEDSVRQKEKLAAVGQLAAGIAHEIRNPLASLSGSVQLMLSQPKKYEEDDLRLMKIITREIDRLNDLITEFLDYVKPEKKPETVISINKVLREVMELAKPPTKIIDLLEKSVELKAKMDILGHHDKLKQGFLNIVINAMQAMEESSSPKLKVETFDVGDRVMVLIRDNGSGMNEETLKRLFEPFYTTKPKGSGLGLAVTHKIFEIHDAHIQVESQKGLGTQFKISFLGQRDLYDGDKNFKKVSNI